MSSKKKKKINEYSCIQKDETAVKTGSEFTWFWVVIIEPKDKEILSIYIKRAKYVFVVSERFLSHIIKEYGEHPVSTYGGTWYPTRCKFLKLNHHIHSAFDKSIIERTMQYINDRAEYFDDYFPCR